MAMKVKVEILIETNFYDEEIFLKRIEEIVMANKEKSLSAESKVIKFNMYISEEK
jgi:hypothetical protein